MLTRRDLVGFASFFAALGAVKVIDTAVGGQAQVENAAPFTYDTLVQMAEEKALKPYVRPHTAAEPYLSKIDYDDLNLIRFDTSRALFAKGPGKYPVALFHMGKFFRVPVKIHIVTRGTVQEIPYDKSLFNIPADSPAQALPPDSGFAGFRVQENRLRDLKKPGWNNHDWVAFLGASYFRAIGKEHNYGLSARGIALDVAPQPGKAEEFPDFTHFWIETPVKEHQETMTVYALLDGPSLCGAYRFVINHVKDVVMDIEAALFLRQDIDRFGIAPLTSMFWFSEAVKGQANDWRPEVHDSDGLAIWTGTGEHIWRPLNNPGRTMASAFSDNNPRGFGLLQRDRNIEHYLDTVYYHRRPSAWVEPLESWGEGSVQLIEIPTDDEIHDNIVAMWVPKAPAEAGSQHRFRYRLHWRTDEPYPADLARCVATRLGRGGRPGRPRPRGLSTFTVEFLGAPLKQLDLDAKPDAVLWSSSGNFSDVVVEPIPDGVAGHWRAIFDLHTEGYDPIEMRLFLRLSEKTLSETWLYQYHPAAAQSAAAVQQTDTQTSSHVSKA
ncbi:glucan biosynthesis protein [Pseudomonas sp. EA_15y_Pfl2_R67]|uniref:glucan biosynthesis protein n=1 Tax=Pseudomonas sp. EA_15y_Pfl2_R67 TaxID=3088687 RepID=UPI0030D7E40B